MSMLDIIAEYNRRVEEEKKLLDKRKFREKVVSNLEEKLNSKIGYPRVKYPEMKKGSRVKIRRDSEYAEENDGVGTMQEDFETSAIVGNSWVIVKFDNGEENDYRRQDLEPVYTKEEIKQIEEENKEIIDEFYKQPFNLFKEYLKQQVEEISLNKNFKIGDKVRMNEKGNMRYPIVREGTEGEIIFDNGDGHFNVKITKIMKDGGVFPASYTELISYKFIEKLHSLDKMSKQVENYQEVTQKLVQESIDYVKNELTR